MLDAARTLRPDVIVADVSMPGLGGIDALEIMRQEGLAMPVVFLTMHNQPGYARRALRAGAAGYVLKLAAPEELVQAIRARAGRRDLREPVARARRVRPEGRRVGAAADRVGQLTAHQREILRHFADGLSAKEIAKKLDISSRTVESHKYQIMESLGAQSSAELVRSRSGTASSIRDRGRLGALLVISGAVPEKKYAVTADAPAAILPACLPETGRWPRLHPNAYSWPIGTIA